MKKILGILMLTVVCCINLTADLTDGLVAYYPFNGNADDESGNGNHVSVVGATLTEDRFGIPNNAYYFDGSSKMQNTSPLNFPVGNSPRSMVGWIFRQSTENEHGILQYGTPNTCQMFSLIISSNASDKLYFYGHYCDISTNESIPQNEWQQVAVTYDGTNVKLYMDGQLDNAGVKPLNTVMNSYGFTIGLRPSDTYWIGKIDDVRIYNRVLSEAEIEELYDQESWPLTTRFTADSRFGYSSLEVNFTDTSINPAYWEWDFQNDGIIDSYEQNPVFLYNEAGIYDVKLKTTLGTYVDSLIKINFIVVQESQLQAPQNPSVTIAGSDAILNWDPVPDADYYLIYTADDPYEDFGFLDYATGVTSYTHSDVTSQNDKMFYIVIGFDGTMERLIEFIENIQRKTFDIEIK